MKLDEIYWKINFLERYKKISIKYSDFDNGLRGNSVEMYDRLLKKYNYKIKYFKKETFYRISEIVDNKCFVMQLVLKDGIIEPMLSVKIDDIWAIPDGRFDFICEQLDTTFSRRDYPIPVYTNQSDLEEILDEVISIYEDFKREVIK